MSFKIRRRISKGYVPDEYVKILNPKDSNDLALLFEDLDMMIGAPIERAFRKFKQKKNIGSPFY